ncbi:glycosyltransferase family 39 protein [Streptomyces cavernae]|uniref:glycosyltransferase family 39 protein n=1 Tax=Streptomyces cavernae TaxID=2259034 RepID=UPI001EE4C3FB|nr:glycosyltransferase family 39 protein [Streptomyces cavernae]
MPPVTAGAATTERAGAVRMGVAGAARAGTVRAGAGAARPGALRAGAVAVPVVAMLAVGLCGIDRGGMWRDEGVTYQVAQRSVPEIWRLLHTVDAVHGLYYLLMHGVLALAPGAGEVVLRLPSVLGACVAAGLVAALGVRLGRPRVGLWAGLLYAATPMVGYYAQEGRSYALVAAGVAGATLLLVRCADGRGRWWAYGLVVAVTAVLHELAVLMVAAHAVTLAVGRVPGRAWRGFVCAVGGAVGVLLPLVLVSHGQSEQVAWLRAPGWEATEALGRRFAGPLPLGLAGALAAAALWGGAFRRGGLSLAGVALPLAVVPPGAILVASQWSPLYTERYVLYALAGVQLLVAAGADRVVAVAATVGTDMGVGIGRVVRARLPRAGGLCAGRRDVRGVSLVRRLGIRGGGVTLVGVVVIALAFCTRLPSLQRDRSTDGRPDDLAPVAALAARQLRGGDPVLFLPAIGRRIALTYPRGFRKGKDIALRVPGDRSGTLYGTEVGGTELRRRLTAVTRVWVIAQPFAERAGWCPDDATERTKLTVVNEEFRPRAEFVRGGVVLRLYVRRTFIAPASVPVAPPSGRTAAAPDAGPPCAALPSAGPASRPVP